MTTLAVETSATVLAVAGSTAALSVTAPQVGTLAAPAAQGPMGPPGKDGVDGGGITYPFAFPQPLPAWTIAHGLGRFPSLILVDTAGDIVMADVTYLDANTIAVAFGAPTAGTAYLN